MDHHDHRPTNNIRLAFFLNLGFTVLELLGGLWTNSLAILSDAVHDLGDSVSLGLAWYLENLADRGEDPRYSYGYRRFSLRGALLNAIVLVLGSVFVIARAIPRLIEPEATNAPGMVLFAIVGIVVNGLAVFRLRSDRSMNLRVVAWHLMEDVLGWIAVLVVAIVLLFTEESILDPVLSVLIAIYVLYNVVRNLRETVSLFMQSVPNHIDLEKILRQVIAIPEVQSTHHTHAWSLDGDHHILTTHVVVAEDLSKPAARRVKDEVKTILRDYDFSHITIEIEFGDDDCAMQASRLGSAKG